MTRRRRRLRRVAPTTCALALLAGLAWSGPASAAPSVGCDGTVRVITTSTNGPLTPGGGSRLANLDYFIPFTGSNDQGKLASYGFVTHDIFCGPYPDTPETIASSASVNYSGPHAGLEPGGETFVVVLSDDGKTYILERRSNATYTAPALFHAGYTAISMQRIGDSLDRLTISTNQNSGALVTQTIETADRSTWGSFLSTPFSASIGITGKTRRATAAWSGNPDNANEILMAWAYDSNHNGYRVIRSARNPDYHTNGGWSAAKTLVSISGKDLTDPRVSRWGDQTRIYFMERETSGKVSVDYIRSDDHGGSWSPVQRIRIPRALANGWTDLTIAMVGKSRDITNPIGLVGGYDPIHHLYQLLAFVVPP